MIHMIHIFDPLLNSNNLKQFPFKDPCGSKKVFLEHWHQQSSTLMGQVWTACNELTFEISPNIT